VVEIKRGEVYWVRLDPTIGNEIRKTRPCVIVSNDLANRFSPLVTVVPITMQKLDRIYPHEVSLSSLDELKNSKVKTHQIRTIDKRRIKKKLLTLPRSIIEKINWALANHLDLIE
jgi:mRNA interferase MazF